MIHAGTPSCVLAANSGVCGYNINPGIYSTSGTGKNAYIGYMFGDYNQTTYDGTHSNTTESKALHSNRSWYLNIYASRNYLSSTAIYCNDRSIPSLKIDGKTNGNGVGSNATEYAGYQRYYNKTPQFKCPQANDKFTTSSLTGNAKLINGVYIPTALITYDEAMYSGHFPGSSSIYLHHNAVWGLHTFTMTPSRMESGSAKMLSIMNPVTNSVFEIATNSIQTLRTVTSLKSCVKYAGGTGIVTDPYKVTLDSACASALN